MNLLAYNDNSMYENAKHQVLRIDSTNQNLDVNYGNYCSRARQVIHHVSDQNLSAIVCLLKRENTIHRRKKHEPKHKNT